MNDTRDMTTNASIGGTGNAVTHLAGRIEALTPPLISGHGRALTLVAAIGSGVVAGVFFAFSTFVMKGLGRLPDREGMAAMQAINKAAPSPVFMTALLGTAVISAGVGISALTRLGQPGAGYQVAGSVLYLASIALTIVYHVPRNDALALIDPGSAGAAATWRHYLTSWTAWNHVRLLTSLGAAVAFILALHAD